MTAKSFSISKHLPVLLLLVFLSFFAHLGNTPLFDPDEGVYSEVTREMLANQDFTSAFLNGMPFSHKPPLFFWAQAASVKILGLNELGLRLPSAMAALLWTISIFLFTRRNYDTEIAWHTTLFMGSSLLVTLIGRSAVPETLINMFLTLVLLNIYRYHQTDSKRHIYWAFMFSGLGVLTKGSISVLLPAAVSILFFCSRKRWRALLRLFTNPVGLTVFCLIVMPWYLGEFMLHGEAFLSELLMIRVQNTAGYDFIGAALPYYTYPFFLFLGLLPFSGLFIRALFSLKKLLAEELMQFMFCWFAAACLLLPLVRPASIFSLTYCLPPLFVIMARAASGLRYSLNLFVWPLLFVAVLFAAPYTAPYLAGFLPDESLRTTLAAGMTYIDASYGPILGAVVFLLVVLPFIRPVSAPVKHAILGLLFVSLINFLILPILGNLLQQPVKSAALLAGKDQLAVVTWRMQHPSFNVYAESLTQSHAPRSGDYVFTRTDFLDSGMRYKALLEKHGFLLAEIVESPGEDNR